MPEAYSWPEGSLSLFTGGTAVSALISYAENSTVNLVWGWDNKPTLSGVYRDVLTGKRIDVTIGALYTVKTIQRIADSATAVHMKFMHSSIVNSTAGLWGFSGRIDRLSYAGNDGEVYKYTMALHFNQWSAF